MRELSALLIVAVAMVAMVAQAAPPARSSTHGAGNAATPATQVSQAAEALGRGDPIAALARADEALLAEPQNPWAHYNRAAALAELRKVKKAVAAYDEAARRFGDQDRWGKSVAMWGKAHLFYRMGRCEEAGAAFADYAKTVQTVDPQAASLARGRAASCHQAHAVKPVELTAAER
jgi:tetratricopeptide (TPR) repeat protein